MISLKVYFVIQEKYCVSHMYNMTALIFFPIYTACDILNIIIQLK